MLTGYQINNFEFRHAAKPGTVQYEHWIMDCFYAYRTGFRSKFLPKYPSEFVLGTIQVAKKL